MELDGSGTGTRARLGCGSGSGVCSGARIYACRFSRVKTRGRDSGACAWTTSPFAHAEGAIRTGHAIVRSRTVTVFCRYHDNYISVVTGADQSGTEVGYKIVLPRSPWYLWLKTTLTLGLRPRVRVVYNHKSLATVVELLLIIICDRV